MQSSLRADERPAIHVFTIREASASNVGSARIMEKCGFTREGARCCSWARRQGIGSQTGSAVCMDPAVGSSDGSMTVLVWTRPSFDRPVPHIGGLHHHYERRAA